MNIARLTVMSLRVCTSRTVPRWSVKVSGDESVLRYRIWVLTLNFSRKGTVASSGVLQMTIPSRERSASVCFVGVGGTDGEGTSASGGAVEGAAVSSGVVDGAGSGGAPPGVL